MRRFLSLALLSLSLAGAVSLYAEEAKKPDEKPGATPADTKPVELKPVSETRTGVLSEKPANAAEGVVAVLTIRSGDDRGDKKAEKKRARKGLAETPAKEEKFNLQAADDVAKQLTDLARKSATVEVTGAITGDNMKVTAVTEKPAAPDTDRKGKGRKKNQ